MDVPRYRASVANYTGDVSWSYGYLQGDPADDDADVLLADQLTYLWGFENNMVPGQLKPATASYAFYCRTAALEPAIQLGDLHWLEVGVGEAGPLIIRKLMRVVSADEILDPDASESHPVTVTVKLVDTLADARAALMQQPLGAPAGTYGGIGFSKRSEARPWWKSRIAELGKMLGFSIGVPDWWTAGYDGEQPDPGLTGGVTATPAYRGLAYADPSVGSWNGKSAFELLVQLLNSHQPSDVTHTLVPSTVIGTGGPVYPAGYEYVEDTHDSDWPAIADPGSDLRFVAVPASRRDGYHGTLELEASWCDVPALARRSREHVINTVNVNGYATIANPDDPALVYKWTASTMTYYDPVGIAIGVSGRDVATQLRLFAFPDPTDYDPVAPSVVAGNFIDITALTAARAYDSFQLVVDENFDGDPAAVLPFLCPRFPDEDDGDSQILRHITITGLAETIDFGTSTQASGFLTAGQLTVLDGDLIFNLTLTPGEPT